MIVVDGGSRAAAPKGSLTYAFTQILRGWNLGLEDGILALRWDLGLEVEIWASRLGG